MEDLHVPPQPDGDAAVLGGRAAHKVGWTCPGTWLSALDSTPGGTLMSYCSPGSPGRKNYPSPCSLRPMRACRMDQQHKRSPILSD